MIRILVAEDDEKLNKLVCRSLSDGGYEAVGCRDGAEAIAAMDGGRFDMIVSDIMMPRTDGFELAETVRAADRNIPILLMTARDDMAAKQKGYRLGIDDYIVKPFDMDELLLRVGALMRRAKVETAKKLEIGNLVMDADEHTAYVGGEELNLTVREFDILHKLLSYPKKTFAHAAHGSAVGLRFRRHAANRGRVYGQAARKNRRLRRVRAGHRARAGL